MHPLKLFLCKKRNYNIIVTPTGRLSGAFSSRIWKMRIVYTEYL